MRLCFLTIHTSLADRRCDRWQKPSSRVRSVGQECMCAAGNVSSDAPGQSAKYGKKDFMTKERGDSEGRKAPNASCAFGRLKLLRTAQKITGTFYQVGQNSNPSVLEIQVAHSGTNGVGEFSPVGINKFCFTFSETNLVRLGSSAIPNSLASLSQMQNHHTKPATADRSCPATTRACFWETN